MQDKVVAGLSGKTETGRKKAIADGLYERLGEMYADLKATLVPDRMLAPGLVADLCNSFKGKTRLANWFDVSKLETYETVRRAVPHARSDDGI